MIPFPFNENRFSFFVADHQLVGQLCTNPKSDRSLLSCLKVTQCSMSEIGDAPLYNSCSLPIQVMTTGPLPAPSKCKSGWPRITGTCTGWWKQSFRLQLWSLMWFQVRATSCHLTSSKFGLKVNTKVYLDVLKSVVIPWCNQVTGGRPWVWQQDLAPAHVQRDPGLASERVLWLCTLLSLPPTPPSTWTRWTTLFGHMSRTSATWPPTTPKPAWLLPSAKYLPSSHWRLWKRHAPSSGSVSRRWLRLKAATLIRCQLYYISKLHELIFFNKIVK